MCSPDRALLASLRARIERIGGAGAAGGQRSPDALPLGVPPIDSVLPGGGLPRDCLHEILAADAGAAASGFATVLLARFAGDGRALIWVRRNYGTHGLKLYGPGLAAFGLDPRRLLVVQPRREADVLWAMEEGLRSDAVAAVLGEVIVASHTALRRLQLAAEAGGATGLMLRPPGAALAHGGAASRWRVASARGSLPLPLGEGWGEGFRPRIRWWVELLRCRAAPPTGWLLDWCYETHRLGVVAELRDGSVAPAATEHDRRAAI
jgi:protein ImuA